jgi:hypothetical protein
MRIYSTILKVVEQPFGCMFPTQPLEIIYQVIKLEVLEDLITIYPNVERTLNSLLRDSRRFIPTERGDEISYFESSGDQHIER